MSDNTIYCIYRNGFPLDSFINLCIQVLSAAGIIFACRCQQYS